MGRPLFTKTVEVEVEIDASDLYDFDGSDIREIVEASSVGIDNVYDVADVVASYDWTDLLKEMQDTDPLALRSCLNHAGVPIDAPVTAEAVAASLRLNWTDLIKAMQTRDPEALSVILRANGIGPAAPPPPTYESVRDGFDALSVESKAQLVAHIFHHIIRSR
jgi:hypothetical protein